MKLARVAVSLVLVWVAAGVVFVRMQHRASDATPPEVGAAKPSSSSDELAPAAASSESARSGISGAVPSGDAATPTTESSGTLRVRIVGTDGPLAGVELIATVLPNSRAAILGRASGTSDARGELELDLSDVDGEFAAFVLLDPDEPAGYFDDPHEVAWGETFVELRLERGGTFSGTVRFDDGDLGEGQARLKIELERSDARTTEMSADIDLSRFAFDELLLGRVVHATLVSEGAARSELALTDCTIGPGESVHRELVFPAGSTVDLSILDALTSQPIEGVLVEGLPDFTTRSDTSGRVRRTRALAPRGVMRLRFTHPDYAPQRIELAAPDSSGTIVREIRLSRGLELGGVVVDARGSTLPGIRVTCEQRAFSATGAGSTFVSFSVESVTDESGHFLVRGLPDHGAIGVTFSRAEDNAKRPLAFAELNLPDDARRERWVIDDAIAISGRVLDAGGAPVGDAQVVLMHPRAGARRGATTDADGRFVIDGAFPSTWIVSVAYGPEWPSDIGSSVRARLSRTFEADRVGAQALELRLPAASNAPRPMQSCRVRAIDAASRRELEFIEWVEWVGLDNTLSHSFYGRSASQPPFRLPAGRYELSLRAPDYAPARREIELRDGDDELQIEVLLEREL